MNVHELTAELVPIDSISPHPRNGRRGNIPKIAESLSHNGQYKPIVVQRSTNLVIAGNHTYKAAVGLGWMKINVTWADVSDEEALRIMIADNATSDAASNDEDAITSILEELTKTDLGLLGTGIDDITTPPPSSIDTAEPMPQEPAYSQWVIIQMEVGTDPPPTVDGERRRWVRNNRDAAGTS